MRGKRKKSRELSKGSKHASRVEGTGTTYNPQLKAAMLEVVENQIQNDDPPETRQTLERLLAAGYSRQEAMEMIGSSVVEEIWGVLHDNKPFDRIRFVTLLDKLR